MFRYFMLPLTLGIQLGALYAYASIMLWPSITRLVLTCLVVAASFVCASITLQMFRRPVKGWF